MDKSLCDNGGSVIVIVVVDVGNSLDDRGEDAE